MYSRDKLIPDHILILLEQSIDMLEGEVYPKHMADLVPGRLRKVISQLERRNIEDERRVKVEQEIKKKYFNIIDVLQGENGRKLGIRIGQDIPEWIETYFKDKLKEYGL